MAATATSVLPLVPVGPKPRRKDVKSGEVLCAYCPAKCCRYFALPIDTPSQWQDFDFIRWYLLHERAAVFVEEENWYLLVQSKCEHLGGDYRCGIYEARPQICRDYKIKHCEYDDDWVYEHFWEAPEQIEEYAEAVLGPREGRGFRSPKGE